MNTKNNQRTRITKMLMKQAFMLLMKEKQTSRITVREICERAEVNRSTFYLHYREPNDILMELEDETISLVREALGRIGAIDGPSPDVSDQLMSFLRYVRHNEDVFRTFLVDNTDPHFRKKLLNVALGIAGTTFRVELAHDRAHIAYLFIVSGSLEVLTDWIRGGFAVPEKNVCRALYALSEGGLRAVCRQED